MEYYSIYQFRRMGRHRILSQGELAQGGPNLYGMLVCCWYTECGKSLYWVGAILHRSTEDTKVAR